MPSSLPRLQIKDNAINQNAESQILTATVRSLSSKPNPSEDEKVTPESIEQLQRDSSGLNQAFKQFSDLSSEILNSYTDLEQRVENLNEELRVVSDKRLNDFEQKTTLAARLQSLLSILPSGVILLDGKGRISEVNPVAEKLLGSKLVGTKWFEVVNQKFAVNSSKTHDSVLTDGRRLHVATCPLEFEAGQLIVLTDISSMHRLQSSVDRNKRLAIVGRAMSTLSHQLRTPLSTALLYVSHLQSNAFSETQKNDMARKLQGRLQQMNAQIDDMLLFAGGGQEQATRVNIKQWLDKNKEQMQDLFNLSQVEGAINYDSAADCEVFVNEHAFGEAIYNLLVNACDAVQHSKLKNVCLTVQTVNNYLVIQVADSGEGISETVQDELFDPFITGKSSGTGLGLAIVQAVMTSSKGTVNWRNLKDSGAEFTVLLPVVQDLHSNLEEESEFKENSKDDEENLNKNRSNVAKTTVTKNLQQVEGQ